MLKHRLDPYRKRGKSNLWYVPYAFCRSYRCEGPAFYTNGVSICSKGHVIGTTDQAGIKIIFNCKHKSVMIRKHLKGLMDYLPEMPKENYRILPYCPSCGETPPESYIEGLRKKEKNVV